MQCISIKSYQKIFFYGVYIPFTLCHALKQRLFQMSQRGQFIQKNRDSLVLLDRYEAHLSSCEIERWVVDVPDKKIHVQEKVKLYMGDDPSSFRMEEVENLTDTFSQLLRPWVLQTGKTHVDEHQKKWYPIQKVSALFFHT